MTEDDLVIDAFDARARRREGRRDLFRMVLGGAAVGGAFAYASAAAAQSGVTDADVLNFALNLEYLEANFYAYATTGAPIPASSTAGTGTLGAATGGRQVQFNDPLVQQYASEIAADELAHVNFLRDQLKGSAVAQPALDLGTLPGGAFSSAARAAGLVGAGASFDPYASANNFLLGAFIFEDVGVTAYKGASPLITNKTYLEAAAGILAAEAYHAAVVRGTLYARGVATPSLRTSADAIAAARDSLDGTASDDRGISPRGSGASAVATITPVDDDAIAFSRSTGQVLNIVYLTKASVTAGGFFPNGLNGSIKTSQAN